MSGPRPVPPGDRGKVTFREEFKLEKFDGDKLPGDGKIAVEVIQGGTGQDTVRISKDGTVEVIKTAEPTKHERSS